jgi:hypothetical protein
MNYAVYGEKREKNFGLVPEIWNKVDIGNIFSWLKPVLTRKRFRDNFAASLISSLNYAGTSFLTLHKLFPSN